MPRGRLAIFLWTVVRTAGLSATLLAYGCETVEPGTVYPTLTADETEQRLLYNAPEGAADDVDVLAVTPELRQWIAEQLRDRGSSTVKLRLLSSIFAPEGALQLTYDSRATLSAAEAFERRSGNCLTFTHLFIAMARELDLDAHYREIPGRPTWETDGEFVVVNRHIVAHGKLAGLADYTVDFGVFATGDDAEYGRSVPDHRARAQHFNNLGARAITKGELVEGLRLLNRALLLDPRLAYVWTNVGTAYMRLGRYAESEAAFMQALRLDRFEVTAINQTQHLYDRMGRSEHANHYLRRAERARFQNPYARFWQGVAALEKGEVRSAVGHLRRAVRQEPEELQFRLQLAKAYALAGQAQDAQQQMMVAAELAQTSDDKTVLLHVLQDITRETGAGETPAVPDS